MKQSTKFREPLYELAASLNQIEFHDPGEVVESNFHEQEILGCIQHYITRPSYRRKLWTVRLFIAGKVRTIGVTSKGSYAARFADMAVRRFAKYRKTPVTPAEVELNFTIEQAEADEANEVAAVALLDEIEKYFLDNGVIAPPSAESAVIAKPRGLKSDLHFLHAEIMDALKFLGERITRLEYKLSLGSGLQIRTMQEDSGAKRYVGPGYTAPTIGDPPNTGPGLAPIFTCKNPVDTGSEIK